MMKWSRLFGSIFSLKKSFKMFKNICLKSIEKLIKKSCRKNGKLLHDMVYSGLKRK